MKAKSYFSIFPVLLLAGIPLAAQDLDDVYMDDDAAGRTTVNNYYVGSDYFYTSRINRFHRPFVVFDYYSPFFTDTYWYTYQPVSLGISIYGGCMGLTLGYNFYYPVYYYYDYYPDYYYSNWYYPYYYDSYYWGFRPFYHNYWYTPVLYNPYAWNRWNYHYNDWGWHNRYSYNHSYHNDFGHGYYSSYNRRSGLSNDRYNRYIENQSSVRYTPGSRRDVSRVQPVSTRSSVNSGERRSGNSFSTRTVTTTGQKINRSQITTANTGVRGTNDRRQLSLTGNISNRTRSSGALQNHTQPGNATVHRNSNAGAGTVRNYNVNRTTVTGKAPVNSARVQQERSAGNVRNYERTSPVTERRNYNYSGESPASRRSLSGSVRNVSQSRPIASIQSRPSSGGRTESVSPRSQVYHNQGGNSSRTSQSNPGERGRRR